MGDDKYKQSLYNAVALTASYVEARPTGDLSEPMQLARGFAAGPVATETMMAQAHLTSTILLFLKEVVDDVEASGVHIDIARSDGASEPTTVRGLLQDFARQIGAA